MFALPQFQLEFVDSRIALFEEGENVAMLRGQCRAEPFLMGHFIYIFIRLS
jgi:hypothetical protein